MPRQSLYPYRRDGIIDAIKTLTSVRGGQAPTIREIAEVTEIGPGTLHSYLRMMRGEGLVTWKARRHRGLRVIE